MPITVANKRPEWGHSKIKKKKKDWALLNPNIQRTCVDICSQGHPGREGIPGPKGVPVSIAYPFISKEI